jgi:hypothetical protein
MVIAGSMELITLLKIIIQIFYLGLKIMQKISELKSTECKRVMLFLHKNDDGLLVEWNHGRMDWYRVDNRMPVYIDSYSYWVPA